MAASAALPPGEGNLHHTDTDRLTLAVGRLNIQIVQPLVSQESSDRLTFWWNVTSAAVALSRHVEAAGDLSEDRVMELGCGLGLVGITAGLCGANVLFTDYGLEALASARMNAALNGLSRRTTDFALVDWENPQDIGRFSMVVGTEVLYDYFFHGSLVSLVLKTLRPNGKVLFADRKRLAVDRFMGRMITAGFRCSEVRTRVQLKGFPDQEISIFELTRG